MSQSGKIVAQYSNGSALAQRIRSRIFCNGPLCMVWHQGPGPDDTLTLMAMMMADSGSTVLWQQEVALHELDRLVEQVAGNISERLAGTSYDWSAAEFTCGVVSLLSADPVGLTAALACEVGPVHFAGEHTTSSWAGTMEGAVRSGWRVADEVCRERLARTGP